MSARRYDMGNYAERVLAACWIQPIEEMDADLTKILVLSFNKEMRSVNVQSDSRKGYDSRNPHSEKNQDLSKKFK